MNKSVELFKMMFPVYNDKIIDYVDIRDMETIFYMKDGSKVIFDALDRTAIYIKPRTDSDAELSEEEWRKEFSRKLKRKLAMRNISQKNLAVQTGMPYNTVCRYARGDRTPDIFIIKKIAKALNCEVVELIDFDYLLL